MSTTSILFALLVLVASKVGASKVHDHCLTSALSYKSLRQQNEIFLRCITHYKANAHSNKFIVKRSKRQVFKGPPEVDENIVSAFLNSPEAVQMVLSYFNKQKNLTPIPVTTTTTTTPRPKPPPLPPKRRRPRPPPPPLSFFFGGNKPLGQLLQEHRQTLQKIKVQDKKITTTTPRPWSPPSNTVVNNPQLLGEKKEMEFFGLNDFVPQSPHNLPLRPMRLKYTSTKEFPSKTYGRLVPMPR